MLLYYGIVYLFCVQMCVCKRMYVRLPPPASRAPDACSSARHGQLGAPPQARQSPRECLHTWRALACGAAQWKHEHAWGQNEDPKPNIKPLSQPHHIMFPHYRAKLKSPVLHRVCPSPYGAPGAPRRTCLRQSRRRAASDAMAADVDVDVDVDTDDHEALHTHM